jgi:hypothetical protein
MKPYNGLIAVILKKLGPDFVSQYPRFCWMLIIISLLAQIILGVGCTGTLGGSWTSGSQSASAFTSWGVAKTNSP